MKADKESSGLTSRLRDGFFHRIMSSLYQQIIEATMVLVTVALLLIRDASSQLEAMEQYRAGAGTSVIRERAVWQLPWMRQELAFRRSSR